MDLGSAFAVSVARHPGAEAAVAVDHGFRVRPAPDRHRKGRAQIHRHPPRNVAAASMMAATMPA